MLDQGVGDDIDAACAHETDLHGSVKLRQIGQIFSRGYAASGGHRDGAAHPAAGLVGSHGQFTVHRCAGF
ncbi:hypothetical protein CDS [Bradyrhizobium sp.]|nr:hypothetical protein CDS [Bradyrhizobium sp.]